MLSAIRTYFDRLRPGTNENTATVENRLRLASAALLIEVTRADHSIDEREHQTLRALLQRCFELDGAELDELFELAEAEQADSTSLYQFTSLIHEHYSYLQKVELLTSMWRVAFADGTIDRYEEHLIRKVADLLYISHSDFIRAKLNAEASQSSRPGQP
ncbi:MAG: TerB family tellurite resistance protein [Pseudomonadota bacterium]|nr:TerB family tellurite resistance protein [Pseudomonadota bacterium]